ncbi:MAG: glycosyltransferase family 4 protein [Pedobacter sp.]|nr:MAG: glycosyltransferase family 4 protein [Pedobacter sp.]
MNKDKTDSKIAIIGDFLGGGGAEKAHATLSVFFEKNGISVHNVTIFDDVSYEYAGELLNLGKMKNKTIFDKLKKVYVLRKYLRKHKFNYIIDFRFRVNGINELLIAYFAYNTSVIYTIHSGNIEWYIPKNKFTAKLMYKGSQIVTVSKAIEKRINGFFRIPVQTIHNPLDLQEIQYKSNLFVPKENNYIIAVGRMNDRVKQFDKLIEAYSNSVLPERNIKLLILGEGKYLDELRLLVKQKKLTDTVVFKGRQKNPYPYQKNALFSVLSSKNEGFGNVIVESLATGTPVVSFDCFAGPNEIITHRYNGLLVEDQNVLKLAEALSEMFQNQELYQHCKLNAVASVQKFNVEIIGKQWLDYLKYT